MYTYMHVLIKKKRCEIQLYKHKKLDSLTLKSKYMQ